MFGINNSIFYGHDYSRNGLVLDLASDLATRTSSGLNSPPTSGWNDLTNNNTITLANFDYVASGGWSNSGGYSCLLFDGLDNYCSGAANTSNNIAGAGTLEIWANFHVADNVDGGFQLFLFSKIDAFNLCIGTFAQNGRPFFYDWTFGFRELYGTSVADGNYHQHIITWSSGTSQLIYYLDTSQKNTVTYNYTSNVGNIVVGDLTTTYNGHMRGRIAAVRMYNRILTSDEITRNYKNGIR